MASKDGLPTRAEVDAFLAKSKAKLVAYPIAGFIVGFILGALIF